MRLALTVRHLLVVAFEVDPAQVARALPAGLEPETTPAGRAVVSVAGFRSDGVRLGPLPVPGFAQVAVRAHVLRAGEAGVCFLTLRASPAGLGGIAFGAPYRPARIRVRDGELAAPGIGVSFRYRHGGPASPPPVGAGYGEGPFPGYYAAAGLRRLEADHDPIPWEGAELLGPPGLEPVLALGIDVREPPLALYAAAVAFRTSVPPPRVAVRPA